MELKQLKYFVTVAETGSFNKATNILYTSQSNVSKVIKQLETDLGLLLFTRSNRGISLTLAGQKMYEYANNILKNAYLISQVADGMTQNKLSISSFPSVMISGVFRRFYVKNINRTSTQVEFFEGTVEEIMDNVSGGRSEIGIMYYASKKESIFSHILEHKKLEFINLEDARLCLYPGKKSSLYGRKSISIEELSTVELIQLPKDFFSIEHDLDMVSMGMVQMNNLVNGISTNSDNLMVEMLANTDVCYMGIYLVHEHLLLPNMDVVEIEGMEKSLKLGYVKRKDTSLTSDIIPFISSLESMIKDSLK